MSQLLETGVEITLIGMGTVFVLLTLLVFILQGMSKLAHRIAGQPESPAAPPAAVDSGVAAAAAAAVQAYRTRHRRAG